MRLSLLSLIVIGWMGRKAQKENTLAEIIAGTFHVFSGPINDQDGYEAVAAGETLDDGALLGMECFGQGVIGTLG